MEPTAEMKTTADYIDALRAKLGAPSDFAAMSVLGVKHRQQVSQWRKLHGSFDEHLSLKVADTLGIDRAEVLLAMQVQRESEPELKQLWKRIASLSIGASAAVLVLVALPYIPLPNGDAGIIAAADNASSVYYVKRFAHIWVPILALFAALLLAVPRHTSPKTTRHQSGK